MAVSGAGDVCCAPIPYGMQARVLLLRRFGMPTNPNRDTSAFVEGYLESADTYDGRRTTRWLIVRSLMSAPGAGVLHEPFQPVLVEIRDQQMRLRGIERVRRPEDPAESAVVQEWFVTVTS